jgi:hypothetical protein
MMGFAFGGLYIKLGRYSREGKNLSAIFLGVRLFDLKRFIGGRNLCLFILLEELNLILLLL